MFAKLCWKNAEQFGRFLPTQYRQLQYRYLVILFFYLNVQRIFPQVIGSLTTLGWGGRNIFTIPHFFRLGTYLFTLLLLGRIKAR